MDEMISLVQYIICNICNLHETTTGRHKIKNYDGRLFDISVNIAAIYFSQRITRGIEMLQFHDDNIWVAFMVLLWEHERRESSLAHLRRKEYISDFYIYRILLCF